MAKKRLGVAMLAGCLSLLSCGRAAEAAPPTVAQVLQYRPKQADVDCDVPTDAEAAGCEVKLVTGTARGSSGWVLLDAAKRPVRRFFDHDGDKMIDVWSYYKRGLEVYREIDTNRNNRPDQFRWLNGGGMKWGADANEDGAIDSWKSISAEEAAEEAAQAMLTRDFRRLQALFVTEAELQSLGLQAQYVEAIRAKLQQAPGRFQTITAQLPDMRGRATVVRVESAPPQCVPGESLGLKEDLYRHPTRTVLYEVAEKQHQWLQTGEMVQAGMAWRLLDVPAPGMPTPGPIGPGGAEGTPTPAEVQPHLDELAKLDGDFIDSGVHQATGPNKKACDYYLRRVAIIQQLLPKLPADQQDSWWKQVGDNLAAAATHSNPGETAALESLRRVRDQVTRQSPGTPMAGYMTYRVLWAEYAPLLMDGSRKDLAKVQAEWQEKLAGFVQAYPTASDTPDALIQLAMGAEFAGKEKEAKRWYEQLAANFPKTQLAAKAEGAIRRLDLEGNPIQLAGQSLDGAPFDIQSLRGKVVAVYYWASYCTTCPADFAKLKQLENKYGSKGFAVVAVNLDDQRAQVMEYLKSAPAPGVHLFEPGEGGGLNSSLATQYGIMGLPTMFLVGKDGKVISRNIQTNDLEDAVQKEL